MSSSLAITIALVVLAACFVLRFPVTSSMIISSFVYLILAKKSIASMATTAMSTLYNNTVLVAVPLFIFTANIMNSGKVTEYMFTFCKAVIGDRKGALAYINILISLIFSGMTGSALADASGIGTMELDEMHKDGYDDAFSCAITAATATVGPIFPPSIPLVIYGMLASVSVGKLFMGGMIPAILICLVLGIYVHFIARKRNYPKGIKFTRKELWKYVLDALPALFTPVVLLGGMYSGVVTATEAGVLAAVYAIIISTVFYRSMSFKQLMKAIKDTVIQTGIVLSVAVAAFLFSYVVNISRLGDTITKLILGLTGNKYVFLMIVNLLFIFLGMLFDTSILQYVFLPLIIPVAQTLGIDMVHFGVLIVVIMMIGLSTPPYGMLCFTVSGMTKTPLHSVFKEVLPMVAAMLLVVLLITFVPQIVTYIPNTLMS